MGAIPASDGALSTWRFLDDATISQGTVNNTGYVYSVNVGFLGSGTDLMLGGATIFMR